MASAGNIVIDLLLKTGSFVTDIARAERSMRSLKKQALDFATVFKASFAGGLATGAVTELVGQLARIPGALNDLVKSAGAFDDIAERIGVASDELAGFSIAAATADTSIEQIAEFSTKLTKALSKVDDESDNAAKGLAAIGIEFQEFKRLDPIQQIEALSKALSGFAKGPEKTAILEGIVKGGSQLLPFLKTLEEQGGRQNILTKQQIELADQFADRQAKSAAQLKAYAQIAVTDALPAVTALTNVFTDFIKELTNVGTASARLNGDSSVRVFAESAAIAIAGFADTLRIVALDIGVFVATTKKEFAELVLFTKRSQDLLERVGSLNFSNVQGGVDVALAARNKAIADADQALLDRKNADTKKFEGAVKRQLDAMRSLGARADSATDPRSTTFGQAPPKIKVPDFGTPAAGKDDGTRKLLDNRLKDLDRAIKAEQDLLTQRNHALDGLNAISLQSFQAYYDAQLAIIEAGGSAQLALIDKQIDEVNKARNKKGLKPTEQADLEGKLQELQDKRAASQLETDRKIIDASQKKAEAEKRFQQQLDSTRASVLELQGNLAAAAAIRFEQQNKDLRDRAVAERNVELQSMLDTLKAAAIAQAEFTKQTQNTRNAFEELANAEERIAIAQLTGAKRGFEGLKALGDLRQKQIPVLEAEVQALEAIAKASGDKSLGLQAEQARLSLERLKATADPLGDTFRDIFTGSATDALTDFITGTKSASEAFKSFADSVIQQISRIVAQNLAEQLFGKGSAGGSAIGDFFSGLFGGGLASFDKGTPFVPEDQLAVVHRGERIIPAALNRQLSNEGVAVRGDTNITVAVQGNVDRRTRHQIANDIRREQRAAERLA